MLIFCSLVSFLVACDRQEKLKELHKHIAHLKETASTKKHTDLVIEAPTPATYQAATLRHPFEEGEVDHKKGGEAQPLVGYPLSMLRFMGTVWQNNEFFGFIQAPDNKIYTIKVGNLIGDQQGKVVNIYEDHLEVREQVFENGELVSQRIVNIYPPREGSDAN